MSAQSFIKIIVDYIPDDSLFYQSLKEYEKHREFLAVRVWFVGTEIHFAAGGHKYCVDTQYNNVQMLPFLA